MSHTPRLLGLLAITALTSARSAATQTIPPVPSVNGYWDPSPHQQHFITVAPGVRVEVLDWGGTGPALLLIPGYGFSAHIYDDFARRLNARYHVLAMTVRGWPPSDAPLTGYTYDTVAADIRGVIDSLHLGPAVLVGHSFGGSLIARAAVLEPARIRALVFLDGALQNAPRDSVFRSNPIRRPPPPEAPDTTMLSQIDSWHQYAERNFYGVWTPALEADLWARGTGRSDADLARRDTLVRRFGIEDPKDKVQVDFGAFRQPALAICALTSTRYQFPWLTPRSPEWTQAERFTVERLMPFQRNECGTFLREARRGEDVMLESGHYIFMNAPAATAGAVLRFLDKLR